jgi:CubicO group peptidase (beta-lactamase class C family)
MTIETVKFGDVVLHGHCAPKYERLREAFFRNFHDHGEIGASYAVMVDGEMVVDLWGGSKDEARARPWERDTVTGIWSASKGIGGVCFAMLVDRGQASYEDKVSKFWPEFAVHGKGDLTIGGLLAHQAGITGFTTPATLEDFYAGEVAAQRLAGQAPLWPVGTAAGYSNAVGILATALCARIDGRSLRQFVADELKGSFGLDLSIGLDPEDRSRMAELSAPEGMSSANTIPVGNEAQRSLHNPPMRPDLPNTAEWQAADIVAANGYGNARALASMYGLLLSPGSDGRRLVQPDTLVKATTCLFDGVDEVRGVRRRWAAGFLLNDEDRAWGPNMEAFGHGGWGGAFGLADPIAKVAIGYAMNHMSDQMDNNPRRRALIDTLYAEL